jgi:hypothetical protein
MSTYTLVSFTSPYVEKLEQKIRLAIHSRNTSTRDGVTANRLGGDKVEMVYEELISEEKGKLIWEIPIGEGLGSGDFLGYLVIDLYEDTGDSHRLQLFEVCAFEPPELIEDRRDNRIHDDRIGEKTEKYYKEEFGIDTIIKAVP